METNRTINFNFVGSAIVPTNYNFIGEHIFFQVPTGDGDYDADGEFSVDGYSGDKETLKEEILSLNAVQETIWLCKCNICNHSVKRAIFFENKEDGSVIAAGLDCAKQVMNYMVNTEALKKESMKARKKRELTEKIEKTFNENEGLEDLLKVNDRVIREIASKFFLYGNISDKQISFIKSLAEKRTSFENTASICPNGRVESSFVVLSHKTHIDPVYGLINVVLMENKSSGYKVYYKGVTTFAARKTEYGGTEPCELEKGTEIVVKGTITPSDKDPYFGFIKRPSLKVVLI